MGLASLPSSQQSATLSASVRRALEEVLKGYDRGTPGTMMTAEDMVLGRSRADQAQAMADSVDRGIPGSAMTAEDMLLGQPSAPVARGPRVGAAVAGAPQAGNSRETAKSRGVAAPRPEAKPMTDEDYYADEEAQVADAIRANEIAQAVARTRTPQGYYDEEEAEALASAQAYEEAQASRSPARPAAAAEAVQDYDPFEEAGENENALASASPEFMAQLAADFRVVHGGDFDPNSSLDKGHMEVIALARSKYPEATPTQIALKIYRGEFD